jgi:preprotein translocase subunit SecG
VIVISILLQPGKADAGALFTSSVSSTAFGPRGTQTLLAKITIGAAITFMLTALLISVPYFTGSRSVLQSVEETATPTPAPTPQSTPATIVPPATTSDNAVTSNANANAKTGASGDQKSPQANANKQANQNKK